MVDAYILINVISSLVLIFCHCIVPYREAPKYIKQILPDIKGVIDHTTKTLGKGTLTPHLYQWT